MTRKTFRETMEANAAAMRMNEAMFGDLREAKGIARPEIIKLKPKREYKKRESVVPSEHDEQCVVITWWMHNYRRYQVKRNVLFAIPNAQGLIKFATNRHAFMQHLRNEGFRDGMLDLMLAVPRNGKHGMFIEMKKTVGGTVSDEQIDNIAMFQEMGYEAQVHKGANSAIAAIRLYMEGK